MPDFFADEDRAQRNTLALRDADYGVIARFAMTGRAGPGGNVRKFEEMFERRLERGQQHFQPYLGCHEFPAVVEPWDGTGTLTGESRELGWMLHDIRFGVRQGKEITILESLRDLALREGLVDDPAFESKPVRWVIELYPDSRFLQLYDTSTPEVLPEGSKTKARMEAKLMVISRRLVRSSGIKADFLVDNAKYVLGLDVDPTVDDPKNAERHAAYVSLLKAAPQSSPELRAVLAFLSNEAERTACGADLARQGGFASNDLFTCEIDGTLLNDVEELRAHGAALSQEPAEGGMRVQCLVCGEERAPARLHNSIQIRGASTSGVPLVSFNANAFEKYGWSGNANAPVCTACMTAYVEALRRLARARYEKPNGKELKLLSTVLTGDTTAIYWADSDDVLVAGLPNLRDYPKSVKSLLESPHKGIGHSLRDVTRFYCLILTGVQDRAIVRRVHTGTVAKVDRNLRHYFAAIDVERFDREAPLPQFRLLQSLVLNGELDRLPADLGAELWIHALFGEPLSRSFLVTVVIRNRAERKVTAERAAMLHLYFNSQPSVQGRQKGRRQGCGAEQAAGRDHGRSRRRRLRANAEPRSAGPIRAGLLSPAPKLFPKTDASTETCVATDIYIALGRNIRELRLQRGWRQVDLAAHAVLSKTHVNELEAGKREVGIRTLERLAEALEVKISELLKAIGQ